MKFRSFIEIRITNADALEKLQEAADRLSMLPWTPEAEEARKLIREALETLTDAAADDRNRPGNGGAGRTDGAAGGD